MKFKAGDEVRLKSDVKHTCPTGRKNNKTAIVRGYMGERYPGGIVLEDDLKGCLYWNEDDLEMVKKAKMEYDSPEYKSAMMRVAMDFCPEIYPCYHCGYPVAEGYCCSSCHSSSPKGR